MSTKKDNVKKALTSGLKTTNNDWDYISISMLVAIVLTWLKDYLIPIKLYINHANLILIEFGTVTSTKPSMFSIIVISILTIIITDMIRRQYMIDKKGLLIRIFELISIICLLRLELKLGRISYDEFNARYSELRNQNINNISVMIGCSVYVVLFNFALKYGTRKLLSFTQNYFTRLTISTILFILIIFIIYNKRFKK